MQIFVNNVNLYYETYGDGQPIILLHGNSENHKIFDKLIENLKEIIRFMLLIADVTEKVKI